MVVTKEVGKLEEKRYSIESEDVGVLYVYGRDDMKGGNC